MNYAAIRNHDIANGEGVRTSLFVSGCTNHCPGCFNPEEQDFNYGKPYTPGTHIQLCDLLAMPHIDGISLLGGDPLCQDIDGMSQLCSLCEAAHTMHKTVWLWTGLVWEEVFSKQDTKALSQPWGIDIWRQVLLTSCDVVVDGPFIESLSDRALKWRGSENQRVIDVKKTLEQNQVILYER